MLIGKNKVRITKIVILNLVLSIIFNFIFPIKILAMENNKEKIQKEIIKLKSEVTNEYTVDYLKYLTFNDLNEAIDGDKLYLGNAKRPLVYCQNIIKIFSSKGDFSSEERNTYINTLKNSLKSEGFVFNKSSKIDCDLKGTALGIITLNMIKEPYDKTLALKAIKKYIDNEIDNNSSENIQALALSLIALKGLSEDNYINKVKDKLTYLNSEGKINGEFCDDFGCEAEEDIHNNAEVIQALVALGEDPTSSKWTDEGNNLIDGLMSFNARNSSDKIAKLAALVDFYNFKYEKKPSMYFKEYKKIIADKIKFNKGVIKAKIGKEIEIPYEVFDRDGNLIKTNNVEFISSNNENVLVNGKKIIALKPYKTEIKGVLKDNKNIKSSIVVEPYTPDVKKIEILIDENDMPIKIKDNITLKILAKDEDGDEVNSVNTIFEVDNSDIASIDKNGVLTCKKEGKVNVKAYIENNPKVFSAKEIKVENTLGLNEISKKENIKIKKEIDNLLMYYKDAYSVEGIAPLALEKFNIKKKLYINRRFSSSFDYAKAIFALKGSKENPRDFNKHDLINSLINYQVKSGENKGLFVVNNFDKSNLVYQSYSVLALDLCGAKYNKEDAIKGIINLYKSGKYNTNSFSDMENKAALITTLAGYKKTDETNKIIKDIVIEFKNNIKMGKQFNYRMEPRAISMVIEALIANNINPLGKNFTKNNENLLDMLLKYKATQVKYGEKYSGFTNGKASVTYDESTSYALCSLTGMYNKKSVFGVSGKADISSKEAPKITINGAEDNSLYRENININIDATNKSKIISTLNGKVFKGGDIKDSGIYNLLVIAEDDEGNKSEKNIHFIIDKNPKNKLKIRIESRDKEIFNKEISIGDGGSSVLDALRIATGYNSIEGNNKNSFGFYIEKILGIKETDSYGWCYAVINNNEVYMPKLSCDKVKIKDKNNKLNCNEIVFYIADYNNAEVNTKLPSLEYEINEKNIKLKLKSENGVLGNTELFVEGKKYKTNNNGELILENIYKDKKTINLSIGNRSSLGGINIVPMNFNLVLNEEDTNTNKQENKGNKEEELNINNKNKENIYKDKEDNNPIKLNNINEEYIIKNIEGFNKINKENNFIKFNHALISSNINKEKLENNNEHKISNNKVEKKPEENKTKEEYKNDKTIQEVISSKENHSNRNNVYIYMIQSHIVLLILGGASVIAGLGLIVINKKHMKSNK